MPRTERRYRQVLRWTLSASVLTMAAMLAPPASAEVTISPAASGYDIDITGPVSSSELIDVISAATGIAVKNRPKDTTINTNHLRSTSLDRALRKLLPGTAFTIRSGDEGAPAMIIFLSPSAAAPQDEAQSPEFEVPPNAVSPEQGEVPDMGQEPLLLP